MFDIKVVPTPDHFFPFLQIAIDFVLSPLPNNSMGCRREILSQTPVTAPHHQSSGQLH